MDYITYSKKRRLEATKILKKTDLYNRLQKFGKTRIIGGYYLDLMIKPDIDFVVKVKKTSETDKILRQIRKMCTNIENISFKKIVDREKFGLDGKSLHLHYRSKAIWGIDILVSTNNFSTYNKLSEKVKNKLTPKKKRDILRLKYYFYKNKKKVPNTPYLIYISVLDEGVSTKKDLFNYLEKKSK